MIVGILKKKEAKLSYFHLIYYFLIYEQNFVNANDYYLPLLILVLCLHKHQPLFLRICFFLNGLYWPELILGMNFGWSFF